MSLLRGLFRDPDPIKGWLDLQRASFEAMLRGVASVLHNEEANDALEEVIAAKARDLLKAPDPTDLGNPYTFLAWVGANHAQVVREQRNLMRAMLLILPLSAMVAGFVGALAGALLIGRVP